jgi:hypothetical protein
MEAFVAYRHTGESEEVLADLLGKVCEALASAGVDAYCTFFDENNFQTKQMNARQIMDHAFETIQSKDLLFVVQATDAKSEGMLMEVGWCIRDRKPIVVATKNGVENTYLPDMADMTITYDNNDDLVHQIAGIDFQTLVN